MTNFYPQDFFQLLQFAVAIATTWNRTDCSFSSNQTRIMTIHHNNSIKNLRKTIWLFEPKLFSNCLWWFSKKIPNIVATQQCSFWLTERIASHFCNYIYNSKTILKIKPIGQKLPSLKFVLILEKHPVKILYLLYKMSWLDEFGVLESFMIVNHGVSSMSVFSLMEIRMFSAKQNEFVKLVESYV